MSSIGKKAFDNNFIDKAEKAIKESGYSFLAGFHYYLLTNREATTAWNYLYKVIRFLEEEDIDDPEELNMENYVRHMATLKDTSSSNRITSYAALKKLSTYLYANDICQKNYMDYVERPKATETQEQINKRENGFLTKTQVKRAFEKDGGQKDAEWMVTRDKAILSVFLGSGIRRAALLKLDINDLNLEEKYINVAEKGSKFRRIYLPDEAIRYLIQWMDFREKLVDNNEKALFISKNRNRMSAQTIVNVVQKYTGKTPHKLRGTYGTNLYNSTHDLYLTQEMMGHSSPKTTELYIRGRKEEDAKKAAAIMNKLFK